MALAQCPKCGHGPLAPGLAADAVCPACGVILAKALPRGAARIAQRPPGAAAADDSREVDAVQDVAMFRQAAAALFLRVPQTVARPYWLARLATLALFALWTAAILADADVPGGVAGSHFLWAVLTPFHEAGHYLIFRWFGEFVMILGGTLGQHLMPIVLAVALLRRGDAFGAALFTWLLGYSVLMMAVYMYDAFDPRMLLLDGRTGADSDGHDWQNLFGDLGLLPRARAVGRGFGAAGRALMLASLAWAAWLLWLQKARLSDHPFAEEDAGA